MISEAPSRQVKSVRTAFRLITIMQDREGVTMSELAEELDLAKSTVHNYLRTLKSLGYVVDDEGTYRLGLRFLTHGMAARNSLTLREVVTPVLEEVAAELSQPTWWIVEEFGRGIFVNRRGLTANTREIYGRIGKRSFLHTHAPGKAILAQLPASYVSDVLDYHGLPTHTEKTIIDAETLLSELETIRQQGYAVSDGEAALGIQSVGVAFEGAAGHTHALGVFGYSHDFSEMRQQRDIQSVLQGAAGDIQRAAEGVSE
ncbi:MULTISPECIES: IclR family transcriptional regulator [Salinibaculum]|uniref:IclR family transcriptional regulator n=1 Tax=Salinibaculum TaxID=2732368 RepID=UPI0030CDB217